MELREALTTFVRGQWDRVGAWVAFAIAGIVLLIGWFGISDTVYTAEQIPYLISGGLGALVIVAIGSTLWLSADLRDEWRKLDLIHEEIRQGGAPWARSDAEQGGFVPPAPSGNGAAADDDDEAVRSEG